MLIFRVLALWPSTTTITLIKLSGVKIREKYSDIFNLIPSSGAYQEKLLEQFLAVFGGHAIALHLIQKVTASGNSL